VSKHLDSVYLSSRLTLAAASGLLSFFAYPRPGLWPLIFVSVAGLLISVRGATASRAALVGFVGGFAFYASQCWWLSQYLGPLPLVALSFIQALWVGLGLSIYALARRHTKTILGSAILFASIWMAREWASTHIPYGGYPWSRLAMSQAESPLAGWVYFGGFSLLGLVIALLSALAVEWLPTFWSKRSEGLTSRRSLVAPVLVLIAAVLVPALPPIANAKAQLDVAAIQGNANAGLFANTRRGEILENHLDATYELLRNEPSRKLDLIVWPENASDLSPIVDLQARQWISNLVNVDAKAPLAFGTITSNGSKLFNSSFLWQPGAGLTDQYDKKRPVPFAEYVPDREFWIQLAPDLIGLIYRDYTFGERDPIYEVNGHKLGVLICFEVAIDEIFYEMSDQGATAILSQTNNADFGRTDQAWQQLAIAKLRSIETGLALVNASTVGPSAIYDRGGRLLDNSGAFERDYLVGQIGLTDVKTPAMMFGRYLDYINLGLLGLALTWMLARRFNERKGSRA
jgi:apolipoprotein N-acyltransferase